MGESYAVRATDVVERIIGKADRKVAFSKPVV